MSFLGSLRTVALGLGLLALGGGLAASSTSCKDDAFCFTCGTGGVGGTTTTTTTAATGGGGGAGPCTADANCSGTRKCCGGLCLDVDTDPGNCGACNNNCGSPTNAMGTCTAGHCALDCTPGYADCDHEYSDGCEASLATDPANCSACGKACLFPNASGVCAAGDAGAGACSIGACNVGFGDCDLNVANGCEANLATDPQNCFACGKVCPPPLPNVVPTCTTGVCGGTGCDLGYAHCDSNPADGCEVNIYTDPENCGGCGNKCPSLPNAVVGCTNGACSIASCNTGYADCDKSVYDGCEVELATDPNNCSACGTACAAVSEGYPGCVAGKCAVGGCDPGYANCNGNVASGCNVILISDPMNCGACGVVCPTVANGTPACSGYVCGIGSCNTGFANCFGPPTACETDLQTDVNHCGLCGTPCPAVLNGTPGCSGGMCDIASCKTGYANCDGILSDGCNVQLATDVSNCGSCNNACPTPAHGVAGCAANMCTLASCNIGFANCDGIASNGCEKSVLTDPMNCGGCGIVCGSGMCNNGACTCNKKVLVIEDDSSAGTTTLATALTAAGFTVTQTAVPSYQYTGANPALGAFGAVVVLAGGPSATSYQTDMPAAGQTAIVNFLNAGNGVVFTEWAAYQVAAGRWQTLAPFVLLTRTNAYTGQVTYTVDTAFASHPVWSGLPATFTFASTSNDGITKVAPFVTRIAGSPQATDAVAIRDAPAGRVVHVAHAGNYEPNGWTNTSVQKLMANATGWVARCD